MPRLAPCPMHVVVTNPVFDPELRADALPERYQTLSGWCRALLGAGAARVTVVQRFSRDVDLEQNGVRYLLRADGLRPWPPGWRRLTAVTDAVASLEPDLVHVNGLLFPLALRDLRSRLPRRVPVVVQDHASPAPRPRRSPWAAARDRIARSGFRTASAFLFTAAAQGDPWRDAGLIGPEQPIHSVPEASRVVPRFAREVARRRSGLPGAPAVLGVGRLDANKDPLTVLDGFERALPSLPDAHLTLVSQGGALAGAVGERVARSSLLGSRVHLRGQLAADELAACYGAADLFVLGSHHEGSGYALLEALCCGVVPVVTDIPSFRALTPPRARALWPCADATALAAAIVALGGSNLDGLRREVLAHFDGELSWPAVGRRALAIYEQLLAAGRADAAS